MPAPQSRSFDLSERITDRLRDLVAKYPKGLGIVKEFLQNADDAGASALRIIYDRREHEGSLDDPGMIPALGPALLLVNDRPFSPSDLLHIQTISDSSKRADASRTGRFGQGFCTAYSVSDEPSLLTGDTLVWFDPHRRILERNRNAYAWELRSAAEQWPALVATFAAAGAAKDGTPFSGTIFRLPVRNAVSASRSEIRRDPFSDADWEQILAEARATGPALLVFLRSLLHVELSEISAVGTERIRLAIRTKDEDGVRRGRAPLGAAKGTPAELLRTWKGSDAALPSTEFTHNFDVSADDEVQLESWEVVNHLCRGPDDVLLDAALQLCEAEEKVLPWAGAAARRNGHWSSIGGGFACFLPLPEAGDAPVWQHGWFALDSSARRNLARVSAEQQSKHHVMWNCLLMRHGVGPAWATLLVRLRGNAAEANQPYRRWPSVARPASEVDAACVAGFYQTVKPLPVFRGLHRNGIGWYSGTQPLLALPARWQARLESPLSSSKIPVLMPPLPASVQTGLEMSDKGPRTLTPAKLRESLLALGQVECPVALAPRTWLSQPGWVTQIAAYCGSDGKEKLRGLPVALLSNGSLRNFNHHDPIYLTEAADHVLLAPFPRRRLDANFQETVFNGKPVPAIGLRALDVGGLIQLATGFDSTAPLPAGWLRAFFLRLEQAQPAEVAAHAKELKRLAIIPTANAVLRHPGRYSTPLLPPDDNDALARALQRLGVELIVADSELLLAIQRFSRRHNGFVWRATADVVAGILVAEAAKLDWNALDDQEARTAILDLLSTIRWNRVDAAILKGLSALPILPTSGGRRVTATQANAYVLADFEPPKIVTDDLFLIDVREHSGWLPLFEKLGLRTLDGLRFATEIVLPAFSTADASTQDGLLRWLRDEGPKLEAYLDERARNGLHRQLRGTAILPVRGGGMAPPSQVYAPDVKVEGLLGSRARKPDPVRFSVDADRWRRFFEWLRLLRLPRAADLHAAVLELAQRAEKEGVEAVRPALLGIIGHLGQRWKNLHELEVEPGTTLASALSTLAWLPAQRLGPEECAMAASPESRLFTPDELAAASIRDLVASQRPIIEGSFDIAALDELGVIRAADPNEVLAHFKVLRTAPIPSTPRALKALRSAFLTIVRYLGSEVFDAGDHEWDLPDDMSRSILVGRSWRGAERVFFDRLTTALPGACSVHDDPVLAAGAEETHLRTGLKLLGVRASPTHDDWLGVLSEIAAEHGAAPLDDDAMKVANGALLQLLTADDGWLHSHTVNVPTSDRRLVPADKALLPGDPRLRHPMLTSIPIVVNIREIVDVARRAGARLLNEALEDALCSGTREASNPDLRDWADSCEALVRSDQFHTALQRLAFHQALQEPSVEASHLAIRDRLLRARRLRLRITDHLRIQSRLVEEPSIVVFDWATSSFLDEQSRTLWLAAASNRRMRDEVVRALAQMCSVSDTLSLSRLLECEPNEMHILLDEDGVEELPVERSLNAEDVASHDSALAFDSASGRAPTELAAEHFDLENDLVCDELSALTDSAEDSETYDLDAFDATASASSPTSSGWQPGQRRVPALPSTWVKADPEIKRPLTDGSSAPWRPDERAGGRGSGWTGQRRHSYLHARPQADYDTSTVPPTDDKAQVAALAEVRRRASQDGMSVANADARLEGFDLVVEGPVARKLIRVVGIDGPWTTRGVPLKRRDLDAAQSEPERWWLHVVEHACDDKRIMIHELQNPLRSAEELRLDDGWRSSIDPRTMDPIVGDIVTLEDGRRATVVRVETFGNEHEVDLQSDIAGLETRIWQPRWKQRS